MSTQGIDFVHDLQVNTLPEEIRQEAEAAGIKETQVLICALSDLGIDHKHGQSWLVVTKELAIALIPGGGKNAIAAGPFEIKQIKKVRTFQTVGSAFLQFLIDGLYIDIVRYSNARRELFGRVRQQLERLIAGDDIQQEALTRPSEGICDKCGLPLLDKSSGCPRCKVQRGIFFRAVMMMRPYRNWVLLLMMMTITGVILNLVPPKLIQYLVDDVLVPKQHFEWLKWILVTLVCVHGANGLLSIFIGRTSVYVGTKITFELRRKMQDKLLGLSVDYYDRHSTGALMSRVLGDVEYFQGFVQQVAQGFLVNVLTVVGIAVMLFTMNWKLACFVLCPIPFVIMGTLFFWKYLYPRYYRSWDSSSKMSQLVSGLLSGVRLVKAFAQEKREQARFDQAALYMQSSRRGVDMSMAVFNPIMGFVFILGSLLIWNVGGSETYHGKLSLGSLMAFFSYIGMFYGPIQSLTMFSNWVSGFVTAAQRVFEILDASSAVSEQAQPVSIPQIAGSIEFRDVTFGYDQYSPILKNVSLKIEPGQFVGIVGKSGSGKTTLVNLICRFYDAQQGEVLIDGVNVRKISMEDLHRQVSLVLQEPFLFRASIAENIAYGKPDALPMELQDAAKASNSHDFIARLPAAYDKRLGERGAGLSGGERQRVSIARALLCDPRILILDEATSSVDTESEQEIQKALSLVCKGRTTIAIAHRLSTLKNADYIYVVDDGRIVESGSHDGLMELNGLYAKLVRIQTELTRLETH